MLSVFWFLVVLLVIWFCFYYGLAGKSDEDRFLFIAIGLSAILTLCAWDWIFSSWFKFIYSLMPVDNFMLMIGTTGLIMFIVIGSFYIVPPFFICWCVEKKQKTKSKYYAEGKKDSIAGKQPQKQNTQYIAGYRDGITVSKDK